MCDNRMIHKSDRWSEFSRDLEYFIHWIHTRKDRTIWKLSGKHPVVVPNAIESECSVRVGKPKVREFLCQAVRQPEEIILCAMSTHWDLQLLPYIWALALHVQLYWLAGFYYAYLFQIRIWLRSYISYHLLLPYVLTIGTCTNVTSSERGVLAACPVPEKCTQNT